MFSVAAPAGKVGKTRLVLLAAGKLTQTHGHADGPEECLLLCNTGKRGGGVVRLLHVPDVPCEAGEARRSFIHDGPRPA